VTCSVSHAVSARAIDATSAWPSTSASASSAMRSISRSATRRSASETISSREAKWYVVEDRETPASLATARCVTPSTPSLPMRRIVASMIAVRIASAGARRTVGPISPPTVQLYCRGV
jgi:hypothetical protein